MSKDIKETTEADLEKAVDEVVEEFCKSEEVAEETTEAAKAEEVVEKSEEVAKEESKEDVKKADKKDKPGDEDKTRGGKDLIKNEVEEDDEEEDKKEDVKKKKDGKEDEEELKESSMKYKSLSEDEYSEYLELKKAKEDESEALMKSERIDELKKAISEETDAKFDKIGDIMKSFLDKVESVETKLDEIGSQSARIRKSAKDVTTIEKSFDSSDAKGEEKTNLNKSQVLNVLTDLCKSGKIDVVDVTIYETSGTLTKNAKKAIEGK